MRSILQKLVLSALVLGLVLPNLGCGSKVDGKYSGGGGMVSAEFKSGKATLKGQGFGGSETETVDYTVKGDTVTLKMPGGDMNLTIMKDGSLQGPMFTLNKTAD